MSAPLSVVPSKPDAVDLYSDMLGPIVRGDAPGPLFYDENLAIWPQLPPLLFATGMELVNKRFGRHIAVYLEKCLDAAVKKDATEHIPMNWSDLATEEPPMRRWATKGWYGFGHPTLLVGPGGIGKSLMVQQWASNLVLGHDFIDETTPTRCLMWSCEDDHDELWRRQVPIADSMGVSIKDFENKLFIEPRHGLDNTLLTTEYGRPIFTPLLKELREQAEDLQTQVVMLDNVAQVYGGNENDRHMVTLFVNAVSGALPGRAIMLLAHPSRQLGSEFSGSSAWENAVRTRLYLGSTLPDQKTDDDTGNVRYLSRRKANYSAKDYRKFVYKDGVLVPEAVETGGGMVDSLRRQRAETVVVDGLKKLQAMSVRATDGKTSSQFLPTVLLEYKLAESLTKRELSEAMRAAMISKKITRGVVGRYSSRNPMEGLMVVEP